MPNSRQTEILFRVAENAPSLLFLTLWRSTGDLQVAGWVGACAALLVVSVVRGLRREAHPILLGINIHFLSAAPIVQATHWLGFDTATAFLLDYAQAGVLAMVLLVGVIMTSLSGKGFVGVASQDRTSLYSSCILLAVTGVGTVWACVLKEGIQAIMPPLLLLFVLRELLVARLRDREGTVGNSIVVPVATGASQGTDFQTAVT